MESLQQTVAAMQQAHHTTVWEHGALADACSGALSDLQTVMYDHAGHVLVAQDDEERGNGTFLLTAVVALQQSGATWRDVTLAPMQDCHAVASYYADLAPSMATDELACAKLASDVAPHHACTTWAGLAAIFKTTIATLPESSFILVIIARADLLDLPAMLGALVPLLLHVRILLTVAESGHLKPLRRTCPLKSYKLRPLARTPATNVASSRLSAQTGNVLPGGVTGRLLLPLKVRTMGGLRSRTVCPNLDWCVTDVGNAV